MVLCFDDALYKEIATDVCEGGAHVIRTHLTVGVSLLQRPTQAYKGNVNVLPTRVSEDPGMDAS